MFIIISEIEQQNKIYQLKKEDKSKLRLYEAQIYLKLRIKYSLELDNCYFHHAWKINLMLYTTIQKTA